MQRIFLIDFLRFIAIMSMISFHIVYDLDVFYGYSLGYDRGFWKLVQTVFAGGLFIFLSGWTAEVGRRSRRNILYIGVSALLVSVATYWQFGSMYVRFGILHFLFVANLLHMLCLRNVSLKKLSILLVSILVFSKPFSTIVVTHEYLVWLDILPNGYTSVDHYPLFPWMTVFIVGIFWGRSDLSRSLGAIIPQGQAGHAIELCSRNSLIIYILHQPVILLVLYLFFK